MPDKAKAAVLTAKNAPFEIKEYELTKPQKGYALLKLSASGICGTDSHIRSGKLGEITKQIIGHEFIGELTGISKLDSESSGLRVGDTAMVYIAVPCGKCLLCKSGDLANCVNMKVTNGKNPDEAPHFHGGFAEYSYAPVKNLIKLPKDIDPITAGVFACPGPTVLHAFKLMKRAGADLGEINSAVVQGAGPVGCFAVMYLKLAGVKNIFVISRNIKNKTLIRSLGANDMIDISKNTNEYIINRINKKTGSLGADLVFEASGNPAAVPLGTELLRNRGVYLIPGQYSNSGEISIKPQIITFKALRIIGSSQYDMEDIAEYIDFLQKNKCMHEFIRSLARCYKLKDINKAFDDISARKNIKTVIV